MSSGKYVHGLLTVREYFKGLTNFTEFVVSLGHLAWVLNWVVGDRENSECLGDVLEGSIWLNSQNLAIVFSSVHFCLKSNCIN